MDFVDIGDKYLQGVADNPVGVTTKAERDTLSKESLMQRLAEISKECFLNDQKLLQCDRQERGPSIYELEKSIRKLTGESDAIERILDNKFNIKGGGRLLLADHAISLQVTRMGSQFGNSDRKILYQTNNLNNSNNNNNETNENEKQWNEEISTILKKKKQDSNKKNNNINNSDDSEDSENSENSDESDDSDDWESGETSDEEEEIDLESSEYNSELIETNETNVNANQSISRTNSYYFDANKQNQSNTSDCNEPIAILTPKSKKKRNKNNVCNSIDSKQNDSVSLHSNNFKSHDTDSNDANVIIPRKKNLLLKMDFNTNTKKEKNKHKTDRMANKVIDANSATAKSKSKLSNDLLTQYTNGSNSLLLPQLALHNISGSDTDTKMKINKNDNNNDKTNDDMNKKVQNGMEATELNESSANETKTHTTNESVQTAEKRRTMALVAVKTNNNNNNNNNSNNEVSRKETRNEKFKRLEREWRKLVRGPLNSDGLLANLGRFCDSQMQQQNAKLKKRRKRKARQQKLNKNNNNGSNNNPSNKKLSMEEAFSYYFGTIRIHIEKWHITVDSHTLRSIVPAKVWFSVCVLFLSEQSLFAHTLCVLV